jgi:hypothetical protein
MLPFRAIHARRLRLATGLILPVTVFAYDTTRGCARQLCPRLAVRGRNGEVRSFLFTRDLAIAGPEILIAGHH